MFQRMYIEKLILYLLFIIQWKLKMKFLKWTYETSKIPQPGEISCKVAHLVLLRDVEQVSIWKVGFTQLGGQVTDHCVSFIYKVQSWRETHYMYLNQYNLLNHEGGWLCFLFPYIQMNLWSWHLHSADNLNTLQFSADKVLSS